MVRVRKIKLKMKRVVCLLVFVLLLNGCDDGNLTVENIDFSTATTESCGANNIIFKLKDKEALLLEIPKSNFVNEPTVQGNPKLINIDNATIRVVYRFYNGKVVADNVCNTIPPALPIVSDQWTATSGTIQIITTANKTVNTTENSNRINGYTHNIVFKNITFAKNNQPLLFQDNLSGQPHNFFPAAKSFFCLMIHCHKRLPDL